jgi:hypothetical protein
VPSSTFWPKESSRSPWSHRRSPPYPCSQLRTPSSIAPPPTILRSSQPSRSTPGESPVRPDPSSRLAARRSAAPGRSLPVPGSRSGWALPSRPGQPGRPTWPGPFCEPQRVKLIPVKKSLQFVSNFRKLQKIMQTCLIHRIFSVYRKNVNYISKCSEK